MTHTSCLGFLLYSLIMFIGFLILNPRSCEVSGILLIFAHMEKFILQQAQALLDHLLDEVPCVLQDIEDLDPIEDYAEVKEKLPTQIEKDWYDLWQNFYEELDYFIENYKQ